jgi:superfamily II DNA or RNA helicase
LSPAIENHAVNIRIDHSLVLTDVPADLLKTLVDRFQMLNPKWVENDRMGRWNRGTPKVLRFYRRLGKTGIVLPRGAAGGLLLLLKRRRVAYRIDDQRRSLPEIEFRFVGSLRSFQETAAADLIKKDFGTLSAPTGCGKTVIGLFMIACRRQPALVVVHTKELALQWIRGIERFLGIPADRVGLMGAGKKKIGEQITVALVQTLCRWSHTVVPHTGHIVVDECHRTPSRTFTEAVSAFDCRYMLGLSATPWRRDRLSQLIFWYLGDMRHEVDKSRLEAKGHILKAEVIFRLTDFTPYFDPVKDYARMLSELTADDDRNRMIASDVARQVRDGTGICLVLSDRKKHCQTLQGLLRYKFHVPAELLTGDLSDEARKAVLERLDRNEVRVLVATGQLIGEGFDCPGLATLFLATPIRFSGRVLQYLGRILRPARGKARPKVYDYVDQRVAPLVAAAKARQRVYGAGSGQRFHTGDE